MRMAEFLDTIDQPLAEVEEKIAVFIGAANVTRHVGQLELRVVSTFVHTQAIMASVAIVAPNASL